MGEQHKQHGSSSSIKGQMPGWTWPVLPVLPVEAVQLSVVAIQMRM
jgi:hypothetical protein